MWSTFWITLERRIHLIFMGANFLLMAYFAIPKNTARQRSTSINASASMRPKDGPILSRLTVMALSTITWQGFCKPLPASG